MPSFLRLISNGLNDPEHPNFGGWGGRYELHLPEFEDSNTGMFKRENWPKDEPETRAIWTNVLGRVALLNSWLLKLRVAESNPETGNVPRPRRSRDCFWSRLASRSWTGRWPSRVLL